MRFTFAGLGGWCQGVMSAECDLPCREHYYPWEEFNTRCHLQQQRWSKWSKCTFKKERYGMRFSGGFSEQQSAADMLPLWPHHTFPTSFLQHLFRGNFSTGPLWLPTQREGQPAVITACKCHLGLLIRPVSYRFNWFDVYHPQHTHICGAQKRGGEGPGVICSFIHLEISCFYSLFTACLFLFPLLI